MKTLNRFRTITFSLIAFVFLIFTASCEFSPSADNSDSPANKAASTGNYRIVGYMPDWQGDIYAVQYSKLTHVCYAFLQANSNGSLDMSGVTISSLQELTSLAHANGTKVLISLGGWSNGAALTSAMNSSSSRSALATNCLNFISQYGLDGFDFDWEGPENTTQGGYYSSFMQTMYNALHPQGKLTTTAIALWYGDNIPASSFAYMDFANLMAYDDDGENHSTYDCAVSHMEYWISRGLPASKCVLGVPFYGYQGTNRSGGEVAYNTICANDSNAHNSDYSNGIGYNGIPTIQAKTNYVVNMNAGGIMIWELSEDASGSKSLLSAIYSILSGTSPTTYTITASAGSNGSISPSGAVSVSKGANKSFSITPNSSSYTIDYVTVDGTNVGAVSSYTFSNVTADHSINAVFKQNSGTQYTITASAGSNGSITPSGSVLVNKNANQTFTITPASGYVINSLVVDGTSVAVSTSYTFSNVISNHSINATFTQNSGGCSLPAWSATSVYTNGDKVHYNGHDWQAGWWTQGDVPGAGGEWGVWRDLGVCTGGTITQYTITATAGANGSISPSGSITVNDGASQTFSFSPSSGYEVAAVTVNGSIVTTATSYTFANVKANQTINVTFKAVTVTQYTITASAGSNGTISDAGAVKVNSGASKTYTFTPASGYIVATVTVDGTAVPTASSYTFTNVKANHTISVSFSASGVAAWQSGVLYNAGDQVTYGGFTWKNVLTHTSNEAWYPGAPGLWFWEKL